MTFLNCTPEEYHARSEMSVSRLKVIADSPRTYYETFIAKTMEQKASKDMQRGTCLHESLLTPDKCSFVTPPREVLNKDGHRKGNPYTTWAAEQGDKIILSEGEANVIESMRAAAMSHPMAGKMLEFNTECRNECGILWQADGLAMRSMIDRLSPNWIFDIKTTRHIGPYKFGIEAAQLRYWMQAAAYQDAVKYVTGSTPDFAIIAIENKAPYRVAVYEFDQDYLDQGRHEYLKAIATYRDCLESGDWRDSMEKKVNTLSLPAYLGEVKLTGFDDED